MVHLVRQSLLKFWPLDLDDSSTSPSMFSTTLPSIFSCLGEYLTNTHILPTVPIKSRRIAQYFVSDLSNLWFVIDFGCSARIGVEISDRFLIILLARSYVWPPRFYKFKWHFNRMSLIAFKTVSLLILSSSQNPTNSSDTSKLSSTDLTQNNNCLILPEYPPSSTMLEKNSVPE